MQSQVQDSGGNEETHEEIQGQANHESREASALCFAAPDPFTYSFLLGSILPNKHCLGVFLSRPLGQVSLDDAMSVTLCIPS